MDGRRLSDDDRRGFRCELAARELDDVCGGFALARRIARDAEQVLDIPALALVGQQVGIAGRALEAHVRQADRHVDDRGTRLWRSLDDGVPFESADRVRRRRGA
jgi:hypothetical protein